MSLLCARVGVQRRLRKEVIFEQLRFYGAGARRHSCTREIRIINRESFATKHLSRLFADVIFLRKNQGRADEPKTAKECISFSTIRGGGKPRNTTLADPHSGSKMNVAKVDIRGKQTLTIKQIGPSISTLAVPLKAGHATKVAKVVLLGGVLSDSCTRPGWLKRRKKNSPAAAGLFLLHGAGCQLAKK